jgi:3-oxoacyl-(acyl-carrier-protein) synthase
VTAAVTGWSLRTPLGRSSEHLAERLLAGERAARYNTRFPSRTYACRLAATISEDPKPSAHSRVLGRLGRFALEVGHEALAAAGASGGPRLGLFSGMGGLRAHWNDIMPALTEQRPDFSDSWNQGFKNLHPFWMLQHLSNNAHALLAQDIGARGDGVTFSGGNAGAQALAAASRALAERAVDVALVIAYDSLIEPETILEMAARGALATCNLEDLRAPYDERASGMVPGEAAAALVLERPDQAGPRAWSRVSAADGADGEEYEALAPTIARAANRLAQGDHIVDGCALGRPAADADEVRMLERVLSPSLRLTAIQAATGLLGAATAPVQAIALSCLLRRRLLPPIAALGHSGHRALVHRAEPVREESAIGLSASAPGLVGAIRVSVAGVTRLPAPA